jgi:poly-beta-1,6-N-acetyl-D-glucosamine synthase
MMDSAARYIAITPVRDEEAYIEKTIESVVSQTIVPLQWIIVDDGSTDSTGELIENVARQYSWISGIHRSDRGYRKAGGGVIDAFYEGYSAAQKEPWDYVVKLDGDLSFQPDYFWACFEEFKNNPHLGIGGGDIYNLVDGRLELEKQPRFHVRGATKIYRRGCWDAIGGLISAPGWDTLDEVKANMLGWETYSFPQLKVSHHRYTGEADGTWKNAAKNGLADYICGYHPLFMLAKCIKRISEKPYLVGSLGHMYGFVRGHLKGVPQVDDPLLIQYIRKQQLNRLLGRPTIWS